MINFFKSSHCFLSDGQQAGWQMAVAAAKIYYPTTIRKMSTLYDVTPKMFINYSDNATKDFKYTSALGFIGILAIDDDVHDERSFTTSQEGKFTHIGEGGVVRQAANRIVNPPNTIQDLNKTYAGALVHHLTNHFSDDRFIKIKRCFHERPVNNNGTETSPHTCLNGITSYFSFLTRQRDEMYHRSWPSNCDECMNYRWRKCKQIAICDGYKPQHKFDTAVIYKYPTQPLACAQMHIFEIAVRIMCTVVIRDSYNFNRFEPHR